MGAGGTALGDRCLTSGYHAVKDRRGYAGLAEFEAVDRTSQRPPRQLGEVHRFDAVARVLSSGSARGSEGPMAGQPVAFA